jgi:hypothetical protein
MNNPPRASTDGRVFSRLATKKPTPVTKIGSSRDRAVRPRSYWTSMPGMLNASMAMKCIDQMPPPIARAAVASQA